jgi:hypothetical protein
MADGTVDLSAALEGLRDELEQAWQAGADRFVRFRVSEVSLTLQAVAGREKEGSGRIRWWLIDAGGGMKASAETTQTLTLTLQPSLQEPGKPSIPLDVGGDQPEAGG